MTLEHYYNEEYSQTIEIDEQTGVACRQLFIEVIGDVAGRKILDVSCGGFVFRCTKAARKPAGR